MVLAYAQARVAQPGEEIGGAGGAGGGLAGGALEVVAGGFTKASASGFLGLAGGRSPACGAVWLRHRFQPPAGLERAGGGVHLRDVAAQAGVAAVLAGEGRQEVDVVGCVTDRHPPLR